MVRETGFGVRRTPDFQFAFESIARTNIALWKQFTPKVMLHNMALMMSAYSAAYEAWRIVLAAQSETTHTNE